MDATSTPTPTVALATASAAAPDTSPRTPRKKVCGKEQCAKYLAQYFALLDATGSAAIKRAAGIPPDKRVADFTPEEATKYAETRAAIQSEEWCAALNGWVAALRRERIAGGVKLTDCHAPLVKKLIETGEYTPTGPSPTVLQWITARVLVKTTSAAKVRATLKPKKK